VTDCGLTVPEALAQFAAAGMPLDETGFRAVVRAARRLGTLKPVGEAKSGPQGGRGGFRYDIAKLQRMHSHLVEYIPAQGPP
jgi:hypothetical protein